MIALCALPGIGERSKPPVPIPADGELDTMAAAVPPMTGAEYLTTEVLADLWRGMDSAFDAELGQSNLTVQEFLKRRQDPKKGDFGGGMYAHGLATIAMCEAYGLTQDPNLRPYAQKAINFIVSAQHVSNGGWRYAPNQEGDTSVTGWQVTGWQVTG